MLEWCSNLGLVRCIFTLISNYVELLYIIPTSHVYVDKWVSCRKDGVEDLRRSKPKNNGNTVCVKRDTGNTGSSLAKGHYPVKGEYRIVTLGLAKIDSTGVGLSKCITLSTDLF